MTHENFSSVKREWLGAVGLGAVGLGAVGLGAVGLREELLTPANQPASNATG